MKAFTAILLFFIHVHCHGQAPLGVGVVRIIFDDKTVLNFYADTANHSQSRRIEFFNDSSINSWNIRDLETQRKWLNPEILWLDYHEFAFRCRSKSDGWLEVIVNNETGHALWIKESDTAAFMTWEEYLKGMFAVERLSTFKQPVRAQPTDSAGEIKHEGRDCFGVKSLKGDWIEIFTQDYCGEVKFKIESGWIRWRQGERLLIYYYTTS